MSIAISSFLVVLIGLILGCCWVVYTVRNWFKFNKAESDLNKKLAGILKEMETVPTCSAEDWNNKFLFQIHFVILKITKARHPLRIEEKLKEITLNFYECNKLK